MNKRKKGAIAIYSIYIIIALLTLGAILMNVLQGTQTLTRVNQAAEQGAQVRAQAIDILLKEEAGIVEVLHNSIGYDDNVDHPRHEDIAGHKNPLLPQNSTYQTTKQNSDTFAKETVVNYVNNAIRSDISGKSKLATVSAKDICFDIKALPEKLHTILPSPQIMGCLKKALA